MVKAGPIKSRIRFERHSREIEDQAVPREMRRSGYRGRHGPAGEVRDHRCRNHATMLAGRACNKRPGVGDREGRAQWQTRAS